MNVYDVYAIYVFNAAVLRAVGAPTEIEVNTRTWLEQIRAILGGQVRVMRILSTPLSSVCLCVSAHSLVCYRVPS